MDDRDLSAEGILRSTGFSLVTEMHRGRDIHYENGI
jgi:hypothetical protein